MGSKDVSRRTLMRRGSAAAVGAIASGVISQGCISEEVAPSSSGRAAVGSEILSHNPRMAYRRLGKTGLTVSEIVLDGHFNDARGLPFRERLTADEVPPEVLKNRADVVSRCIEHGINYLDITSGAEALAYKTALKQHREQIYVAADDSAYCMRHTRHRNVDSQIRNIESCLNKLGTDYLDVWRPQFKYMDGHRDVEMEMCIGVFEKARRQGKARYLGMATHDRPWIRYIVERFPQYAIVYTPYTMSSEVRSSDRKSIDPEQLYEPSDRGRRLKNIGRELFEKTAAQGVGVITTNPFGGKLRPEGRGQGGVIPEEDLEAAPLTLAYILNTPDISAVAVGMALPSHVDSHIRALSERRAGA